LNHLEVVWLLDAIWMKSISIFFCVTDFSIKILKLRYLIIIKKGCFVFVFLLFVWFFFIFVFFEYFDGLIPC
jgi:hypothetical protein